MHNLYNSKTNLVTSNGNSYTYYSLESLEKAGFKINNLPVSLKIILESLLRNYDDKKITEETVKQLASWMPNANRVEEIPFVVSRVILQDFTGVPLLCDLAAMRDCAINLGQDPKLIEPLVPVDLVVDHSVQVDYYRMPNALKLNMEIEFRRNKERYQFMKWGMQAFDTFKVVPPGIGIVHQVNLEYLFRGIHNKNNVIYPDTLVGTDSHTTMINGVGVVGWGVGGIEAEAAMLGQPVYLLTPDVIGVKLTNKPMEGITATDIVLTITEMLRKEKVVGKFVEFFGTGAKELSVTDRATISNMAPEYGATIGFFPVDEKTVEFLKNTGKTEQEVELFETYYKTQNMFGIPTDDKIHYTKTLALDLSTIQPSVAGPRRPQDRINLSNLKETFINQFIAPISENGFNKNKDELVDRYNTKLNGINIGHGDILIAAITSCTNTSNPSVMLAAGLLAKKAVERGLRIHQRVKTSLAPGSRVVTEYLSQAGLLPYLEELGFNIVGYGCTTCIGNSGDLRKEINDVILQKDVIACSVLSGNRNFEARIHPNIKANFLASPPLVVAFAIAGKVTINLDKDPIGYNKSNQPIYLKDIWPSNEEINNLMYLANKPQMFEELYGNFNIGNDLWHNIQSAEGINYNWPKSTYIAKPPFLDGFSMKDRDIVNITNAKALLVLGDSVTTDHISPAGSFKSSSPAGEFLNKQGVEESEFNSYGSRRGNHDVMMRGTFANVRIKNLMLPTNADGNRIEGGYTLYDNKQLPVFDVANKYMANNTPTIVFAGEEYGTGSSRDWAAKGTALLGVKVVVAKSFERIHRSNLVGMGVLPLQFINNESADTLNIRANDVFDITGLDNTITPQQTVKLVIKNQDGTIRHSVDLLCRIDTPIEIDYYRSGGILPYVLRQLIS